MPPRRLLTLWHPQVVCGFAVLAIVASSFLTFIYLKHHAHDALDKSLQTVLDTTSEAIAHWSGAQKITVQAWAQNPAVNSLSTDLLSIGTQAEALIFAPAQQKLKSFFEPVTEAAAFEGYFIVNRDNINIASSRSENIGIENILSDRDRFLDRAWSGETIISPPLISDVPLPDLSGRLQQHRITMLVVSPLIDEHEQVHALLMLRLNPLHTFTSILRMGRIGESGETYAIDATGRLASESRFNEQLEMAGLIKAGETPVMNIRITDPGGNLLNTDIEALSEEPRPLTHMARLAIKERKPGSRLDSYKNYRGVDVIGAWVWNEELQIGIATELDSEEAYAGLRNTGWFILGSAVLLSFLSLLVLRSHLTVRRHAEEAIQLAVKAIDADRLKSEFLANMSHEIRTPMNGVLGMLEILQDMELPEKAKKYTGVAYQSADDLLKILNDILDYSRLESGRVNLEHVSFCPKSIVADLIPVLRPEADRKNITLSATFGPDLPAQISGDPGRLRQVLTNLIHNGIKFTDQGAVEIKVSQISAQQVPVELQFEIHDTGPGIPADALPMMFERFHQADLSSTKEFGGAGLGLAICQQLSDLMGGTLQAKSAVGQGSCFTLTLPMSGSGSARAV